MVGALPIMEPRPTLARGILRSSWLVRMYVLGLVEDEVQDVVDEVQEEGGARNLSRGAPKLVPVEEV